MSENEKKLHTQLESLLRTSKKDAAMLAAFEACGRVIEELKMQLFSKEMRIEELEKRLAEAMKRES